MMKSLELGILSYLVNSLWQVPLMFAAGWLAMRALRSAGAEVEHRVWVVVLLLQSVLPAFSLLPLEWLRRLSSLSWQVGSTQQTYVSVITGSGRALERIEAPGIWLAAIAFLYGTVTVYFLARFVWRWIALSSLRRQSVPLTLTGQAAACWERCARTFAIDSVLLATSSRIAGAVTMGMRRKLVLLPAGMIDALSEAEIETIITHEFAHMRREDFIKNLLYEGMSLPVAYHPLLWFTRARIMESREMICDEMAAGMTGRKEYARSLLRLARLLVDGPLARTPHTIGIFDANAFERRIMTLKGKATGIRGWRRVLVVAACSASGLAICGSAVALAIHAETPAASNQDGQTKQVESLDVPQAIMQENILTKVPPVYPPAAKKAKIQGTVMLNAVISKHGTMEKVTAVSGPKELQQSALDAVRQWTYKPYLLNGDPVQVVTTIKVIYSLKG